MVSENYPIYFFTFSAFTFKKKKKAWCQYGKKIWLFPSGNEMFQV